MTTQTVLTKPLAQSYSVIEPLPDPPRRPDMMEQFPCIMAFVAALGFWFRNRNDVFIGSGGYLWRTSTDKDGPYPDGVFADGLEDPERIFRRNGYVISEVGKPPDLVLEVGSHSTGRRDYTVKRARYADYGVGEYWRFDPSGGEYHDAPLACDKLLGGNYEPVDIVSEPDGRHWCYSEALGLEIWWDDGRLRFRDPATGHFLRTLEESEGMVESERAARLAAEARVADMESELRRLRGE